MNKPIKREIYYSEVFRTPDRAEEKLSLWVDRIGSQHNNSVPRHLRVLGLYAAVHILRGRGHYLCETETVSVQEGETILMFPRTPAAYQSEGTWETQWIVWGGAEAACFEELKLIDINTPLLYDPYHRFQEYFSRLAPLMREETASAAVRRKATLLELADMLYTLRRPASRKTPETIARSLDYLTTHIDDPLTVAALAEQACVSTPHYRRLFKTYTGRSPKEYLTRKKIDRAKELLAHGLSVKETAARLSFNDLFHFMRLFKQIAGTPPGRFQQSLMK